jgi:hypothetical protein
MPARWEVRIVLAVPPPLESTTSTLRPACPDGCGVAASMTSNGTSTRRGRRPTMGYADAVPPGHATHGPTRPQPARRRERAHRPRTQVSATSGSGLTRRLPTAFRDRTLTQRPAPRPH